MKWAWVEAASALRTRTPSIRHHQSSPTLSRSIVVLEGLSGQLHRAAEGIVSPRNTAEQAENRLSSSTRFSWTVPSRSAVGAGLGAEWLSPHSVQLPQTYQLPSRPIDSSLRQLHRGGWAQGFPTSDPARCGASPLHRLQSFRLSASQFRSAVSESSEGFKDFQRVQHSARQLTPMRLIESPSAPAGQAPTERAGIYGS
jgi:hypothetical protein